MASCVRSGPPRSSELLRAAPALLLTAFSVAFRCGAGQVEYETLPGWQQDISKVRRWEDLPPNARSYIQRIEDLTGVYCRWIGVGPGRDAIVVKPRMGRC